MRGEGCVREERQPVWSGRGRKHSPSGRRERATSRPCLSRAPRQGWPICRAPAPCPRQVTSERAALPCTVPSLSSARHGSQSSINMRRPFCSLLSAVSDPNFHVRRFAALLTAQSSGHQREDDSRVRHLRTCPSQESSRVCDQVGGVRVPKESG